jgi:hypothetical protein
VVDAHGLALGAEILRRNVEYSLSKSNGRPNGRPYRSSPISTPEGAASRQGLLIYSSDTAPAMALVSKGSHERFGQPFKVDDRMATGSGNRVNRTPAIIRSEAGAEVPLARLSSLARFHKPFEAPLDAVSRVESSPNHYRRQSVVYPLIPV